MSSIHRPAPDRFRAVSGARVDADSGASRWTATSVLELQLPAPWSLPPMSPDVHCLIVNRSIVPTWVEQATGSSWRRGEYIQPQGALLVPTGRQAYRLRGEPCELSVFTFEEPMLPLAGGGTRAPVALPADVCMALLAEALGEEARRKTGEGPVVQALARALSLRVADLASSERRLAVGGLSPHNVATLRRLIEQRFHSGVSLDELAEAVGLSACHVSREFKRTIGVSPRRYLVGLRVERAKALLARPDGGIDDIARAVGFCDASHMGRTFRRHVGVSPSTFRRRAAHAVSGRGGQRRSDGEGRRRRARAGGES